MNFPFIARKYYEEVVYMLECLLCYATGGKLSKHTYSLKTMEIAVDDYIDECCAEKDAEKEALIAGQETLQKYIAKQEAEIEFYKERTNKLDIQIATLLEQTRSQKAEIERLKAMNQSKLDMIHDLMEKCETAKAEAIKEFAERLKSKAKTGKGYLGNVYCSVAVNDVNETYREMTGESNAE